MGRSGETSSIEKLSRSYVNSLFDQFLDDSLSIKTGSSITA